MDLGRRPMSILITWSLTEHSLLYLLFYGGAAVLALQTGSPLRKWRYGTLAPPWRVLQVSAGVVVAASSHCGGA